MKFRDKETGDIYRYLAHGICKTDAYGGAPLVIYCPDDNENTIYVRDEKEFFDKFKEVTD